MIDLLIKIFSIVASLGLLLKIFLTITNKTEIEIIFTPHNMRIWESFIERIFLSLLMTALITIGTVIVSLPNNKYTNYFGYALLGVILISLATLFLLKPIMYLSNKKPKPNGIMANTIFFNLFCVTIFICFININTRGDYRKGFFESDYVYLISFILLNFFILFCCLYIYRSLFQYIIRPTPAKYRVKKIINNNINEELDKLFFIFMLDSERHVFSRFPTTKNKMKLPAYIYYPKENVLYYYHVEKHN